MSSESTPEVYERGRRMDAQNQAMRDIRSGNDPDEPTRV